MSGFDIDTLIIGQGLAGSLLAWELSQRGERVLVIDDEHASASSVAAAGLINPVTGQRMVKTDGVDALLATAMRCYRRLERTLGRPLLVEKIMWRLLRRDNERRIWQKRKQDPAYDGYLGEWLEEKQLQPPFIAPAGGFEQHHTGYLDTNVLLAGLREHLQETGRYQAQRLTYDTLVPEGGHVAFEGMTCARAIFCEGYKAIHNPWFNWLPFTPAKGEILSLRFEQPLPDVIVNAGRWLMPRRDGEYRFGATYEHKQLDEVATEAAKVTLLRALSQMLVEPGAYQITGQQAGVRPATTDRQPFIGLHPHYPQLGIFNGFGSKGSLLIPWHAERFADALQHKQALPVSCDLQRHLSLYPGEVGQR